jgi:3-deoxy-7-phosphoheptulonate synthase
MIIRMRADADPNDINYVIGRARSLGLKTHVSQDDGHTLIGLLGDTQSLNPLSLSGLRGVEKILPLRRPFRLASREYRSDGSVVTVRGVPIGGNQIVMMAGPCSVESRDQMMTTARAVKEAGALVLRGGAFKARTSPYSFRGLAEEGLKLLAEAREETGLAIITEVMAPEHVPLLTRYTDILQIGTRNMQNFELLDAVGESKKPVLLKRGMMSTLEELLLSAEYILSHGNHNVILCERGIRTFETYTRNTLDINAIPALKEMTHLPVIVDPSHATGRASLVRAVSRAAVAAGADGLLIEVHPDPENALSDGPQSITPAQFATLMEEVRPIAQALGRTV